MPQLVLETTYNLMGAELAPDYNIYTRPIYVGLTLVRSIIWELNANYKWFLLRSYNSRSSSDPGSEDRMGEKNL